jgi:hypothetical protein
VRFISSYCALVISPLAKRRSLSAAKSPPYVVRRSPTHGRGVFATRTIRKGSRIAEYRGVRLASAAADERPLTDPADPCHILQFELSDGSGSVIDASQRWQRCALDQSPNLNVGKERRDLENWRAPPV